jgi:hypothetical protein
VRAGSRLLETVLLGLALVFASSGPSAAQQAPSIGIAGSIAVAAPSQTPLGITVGPLDGIPRNSFVRLRGLPPMAALSEGHSIAPGAWAVSIAALPNLKLTVPASAGGRMEVLVTLVSMDGVVLAEARTMLQIGSNGGAPTSATVLRAVTPTPTPPTPPAATPKPAAPSMTPEDRERAQRLFKRGQDELSEANLSSARLFFERAADAGLAEAALALGATYDSAELQRLNIRGAHADAKEARRWYERAAQLGAPEAGQRLQRLGKN